MKWWYVLCVALLAVASVSAARIPIITDTEYTAAFSARAANERGACTALIDTGEPTAPGSTANVEINGFWPSAGPTCAPLHQQSFQWGADAEDALTLITDDYTFTGTHNTSYRAGFTDFVYTDQDTPMGRWRFISVEKARFDDFTTTTRSGSAVVPLMTFGWCGDMVDAEYTTSTIAPSKMLLSYSGSTNFIVGNDHCRLGLQTSSNYPLTYRGYAGSKAQTLTRNPLAYAGTIPSEDRPFSLPLRTACANYGIEIQAVEYTGDWMQPSTTIQNMARNTASGTYTYNWGSTSRNELTVTLNIDSRNVAQSISIQGTDSTSNVGGVLFTIYCFEPADPDTNKDFCEPGNDWLPGAPTSGSIANNYCCGDDGAADANSKSGGYTCTLEQGTYTWKGDNEFCSYPAWWTIYDASGQRLTADQLNTDARKTAYDEPITGGVIEGAAYIPQGCCSDPANVGRIAGDALCVVHTDNRSRWVNASMETVLSVSALSNTNLQQQLSTGSEITIASTGSAWRACGTGSTLQYTLPIIQPGPSCLECSEGSITGMATAGSGEEDITCALNNAICNSYPGTTCTVESSACMCPAGQSWDGTACSTPSCPTGYTYNASISGPQKCQRATPVATGNVPAANICDSARNSNIQNSPLHICYDGWQTYNPSRQYLLLGNEPTNDRQQATAACTADGIASNRKPNPTKREYGFCTDNSTCYLDGVGCIDGGRWRYNDYCLEQGSGSSWETRTRLIADALYSTTNGERFILHCDSSAEALNIPGLAPRYEDAELISGFCVLSRGESTTIGVVLNPEEGMDDESPAVSYFTGSLKPFVRLLNNTREFGNQSTYSVPCMNAETSTSYTLCTGYTNNTGNVYYNNAHAALILAEGTFSPPSGFLDSIRGWWNGLRFGETRQLMPFGGEKMYYARGSGGRLVQGRLEYVDGGATRAVIVATNLPDLLRQCQEKEANDESKYDCVVSDEVTIITIEQPSQNDWEYFTLRIRPQ